MSDNFCDIAKRLAEKEAERWAWARPTAPPDIDMADVEAVPHNQTQEVAEWYRAQYQAMQAQVRLSPIGSYIAGQSSLSLQTPRAQLPEGFFDHYPFGWMGA